MSSSYDKQARLSLCENVSASLILHNPLIRMPSVDLIPTSMILTGRLVIKFEIEQRKICGQFVATLLLG